MGNRNKAALKRHYRTYQSRPDQIKKRAQRNAARRKMEKAGLVRKGDGKDVNHKQPISKGGGNSRSNLNVQSKSKNRGFKRTSTNKVVTKRKK